MNDIKLQSELIQLQKQVITLQNEIDQKDQLIQKLHNFIFSLNLTVQQEQEKQQLFNIENELRKQCIYSLVLDRNK